LKVAIIAFGVITLLLGFGLRWVVRFYRTRSAAMEPALRRNATLVVVPAKSAHTRDIVVFRDSSDGRAVKIARVVAVAGETVEIRDKALFVDGRAIVEPYVRHTDDTVYPRVPALPEPYRSRDQFGPYTVPAGCVFALGDNRDQSYDSRFTGAVRNEHLIGRVAAVFTWRDGFAAIGR
jgi:signal peptidase I